MSGVFRVPNYLLRRIIPAYSQRLISTSKKNSDATTAHPSSEAMAQAQAAAAAKPKTKRNWVSYGFDPKDEEYDLYALHTSMFWGITVCLVGGAFIFLYQPDVTLRDWSQREAFIELRRREANGLPLIDPNLISPSKMKLPSDDQIGDAEVII